MSDQRPEPTERVRVRRSPRFGVFAGVGVVLGVIAALILTSVFPVDEKIGFAGTFGYLALYCVVIGVVVGILVGLVLDAVLARRARTVAAEVEVVDAPDDAELEVDAEPAPRIAEPVEAGSEEEGGATLRDGAGAPPQGSEVGEPATPDEDTRA